MAQAIATKRHGRWPRIHLVYFALAAIDLFAIIGGLALSHWVIRTYEQSVESGIAADRQYYSSWNLAVLVNDIQYNVTTASATGQIEAARTFVRSKTIEFERNLLDMEARIDRSFPAKAARRAQILLGRASKSIGWVETSALKALDALETGNEREVKLAFSTMAGRLRPLLATIDDINKTVTLAKRGDAELRRAAIATLRGYEWVIGMIVACIVMLVAMYGHYIGTLMKRKYGELQHTYDALESAHDQALAFAKEIDATNRSVTELNKQLADNVHQLKEAQDEIIRKGKLAHLGQLTATVAHELRNPLGAVRTSAFLLERKLKDKGLGIEAQLQRINSGITRCDETITQLLDFSRSRQLSLDDVDLDQWLTGLIEDEAKKLPSAVAITCELGLAGRTVPVDTARLQRAVINLVANAAEAMVGKGDMVLKNPTSNPQITVTTGIKGGFAEIVVRDNGPGISPENLVRIREPMFTTKNFGTGLGIPAVEQIVVQHGGRLEIVSNPGEGAMFSLYVPLEEKQSEAA
jgi:signal transduction histidine kinase